MTVLNENHKAHHILLLSTSILLNPFCPKYSSLPHNTVVDLIGKDIVVDVLGIEQAVLLYHICQIALESYSCNFTRYIFEVTRTICHAVYFWLIYLVLFHFHILVLGNFTFKFINLLSKNYGMTFLEFIRMHLFYFERQS